MLTGLMCDTRMPNVALLSLCSDTAARMSHMLSTGTSHVECSYHIVYCNIGINSKNQGEPSVSITSSSAALDAISPALTRTASDP